MNNSELVFVELFCLRNGLQPYRSKRDRHLTSLLIDVIKEEDRKSGTHDHDMERLSLEYNPIDYVKESMNLNGRSPDGIGYDKGGKRLVFIEVDMSHKTTLEKLIHYIDVFEYFADILKVELVILGYYGQVLMTFELEDLELMQLSYIKNKMRLDSLYLNNTYQKREYLFKKSQAEIKTKRRFTV